MRVRRRHHPPMEEDRDVFAVARAAVLSFGTETPGIMERRAEAHLRADEREGAEFWKSVAAAARLVLAGRSRPRSGPSL